MDVHTTTYLENVETTIASGPIKTPLIVDDLNGHMVYAQDCAPIRDHHHGQRKLLIEEVKALTEWNPPAGSVVVYAGAAPGDKNAYLASLFPKVRFICVDPAPFNVKRVQGVTIEGIGSIHMGIDGMRDLIMRVYANATQVFTIQDYMTCDLAEVIADVAAKCGAALYFISDIRTERRSHTGKSEPTSVDIMWNHSQQYNWYRILKPTGTMFKFRLPFYNEPAEWIDREIAKSKMILADFDKSLEFGLDFRAQIATKTFQYPQGTLFVQAWSPKTSAETRLSIMGSDAPIVAYMDMAEYEGKMFHYNLCTRMFRLADNPNASRLEGFDNCCDCAIENAMWTDYIKINDGATNGVNGDAANTPKTVIDYVKELSRLLDKGLIRGGHGRFFEQVPLETARVLVAGKTNRDKTRDNRNGGYNGKKPHDGKNSHGRRFEDMRKCAVNRGPK